MEALYGIFRVEPQNWKEWLAAIAIGAGAMPVAILTKIVNKCAYRTIVFRNCSVICIGKAGFWSAVKS